MYVLHMLYVLHCCVCCMCGVCGICGRCSMCGVCCMCGMCGTCGMYCMHCVHCGNPGMLFVLLFVTYQGLCHARRARRRLMLRSCSARGTDTALLFRALIFALVCFLGLVADGGLLLLLFLRAIEPPQGGGGGFYNLHIPAHLRERALRLRT